MMKQKKHLYILGVSIVIALVAHLSYQPKNFKYPYNRYDDINIPEDLTVVFVKEMESITLIDYLNKKQIVAGNFNPLTKQIKIVDGWFMSSEDIKNTLIHELAHYEYAYNLTEKQKEDIKTRYKWFCQNPDEFYAYTVGYYGFFNYD